MHKGKIIELALLAKGYRVIPEFNIKKYMTEKQTFDTRLQGRANMCYKNRQYWRDRISQELFKVGFKEGGMYSTSACFRWYKNKNGWKLSWGMRYNITGKRTKYFTLYRYFETEVDIISFLNPFLNRWLANQDEFDKVYGYDA